LYLGTEQRGTRNGPSFDLGAFDLDGTVLRRTLPHLYFYLSH